MRALSLLTSLLLLAPAGLWAQEPARPLALFPSGYLDGEALAGALKRVTEAHPRSIRLSTLGKNLQGRSVLLATLGHAGPDSKPPRPAILIVANLEADHIVGSQVALNLIERLADADGRDPAISRLLDRATLYVVPRLNPDGVERFLKAPRGDLRTNLRPMDRDRDGRSNEDGPDDLDGDGLLTRMRVRDAKANLVADEKDPRLTHRADPAKGERATFREFSEGLDNDGDGRINEDPDGGVNLNRNWPHRWAEFDPEAGWTPASEPETSALIQFTTDHPEIAVIWSFGLNDNLAAPYSSADEADKPIFAELSRLFNKAVNPPRKDDSTGKPNGPVPSPAPTPPPGSGPRPRLAHQRGHRTAIPPANEGAQGAPTPIDATTDGALSEWAYHQFGVVGLASRLWPAPDLPGPLRGQPAPPAEGESRWLEWNDRVMDGRAFVPFAPFDHPTLGRVEIGGWKPGVRLNPPIERVETIVASHLVFLKELLDRLPDLSIKDPKAEARGGQFSRSPPASRTPATCRPPSPRE